MNHVYYVSTCIVSGINAVKYTVCIGQIGPMIEKCPNKVKCIIKSPMLLTFDLETFVMFSIRPLPTNSLSKV